MLDRENEGVEMCRSGDANEYSRRIVGRVHAEPCTAVYTRMRTRGRLKRKTIGSFLFPTVERASHSAMERYRLPGENSIDARTKAICREKERKAGLDCASTEDRCYRSSVENKIPDPYAVSPLNFPAR